MTETNGDGDGRRSRGTVVRWVVLTGNRLVVALLGVLGIFALFVAVGATGLLTVTAPSQVMWYLNGTVNGLLTLVPIVVAVNQIVLSHEFGSIQDQYERRADITEFRERFEDHVETTVSSPRASGLFGGLLSAVADVARRLRDDHAAEERADRPVDELDAVAGAIVKQAEGTNEALTRDGGDMLATLNVMLDYDDSRHFDQVRRLRSGWAAPESEAGATLEELEELFVAIDAARQYLKTVVVERQLSRLSELLVYTGMPAVAVAALGIFTFREIAALSVPYAALVGVVGALVAATILPLAILSAFVLRVATIARRTAAYGPFVPERGE